MNAPNNNTAPNGLRGWWASPPRSGMQRIISPWEYRHPRAVARVRMAAGIVLAGLGAVTLVGGFLHGEGCRVGDVVPGGGGGKLRVGRLGPGYRSFRI